MPHWVTQNGSLITSLDNKSLLGVWPEVDDPPVSGDEIACREWLGGVLKHYERKAA